MIALLSLPYITPAGWLLITLVLLASLVALAIYTISLYRRVPRHDLLLIGQTATVVTWSGRDRRVELFGAIWQAQLSPDTDSPLQPGDMVRVQAVHNLVLTVKPIGEN